MTDTVIETETTAATTQTTAARVGASLAYSRSGLGAPLGRPRAASQSTPGMQ
ncbi:hypothetical protein [Streptomyces sp. SYSU K217416]